MKGDSSARNREVVCFFLKREKQSQKLQILLGLKTQKIGKGKRNGYGGHAKLWESPEMAAIREVREEAGVFISKENLYKRGYINIRVKKPGSIRYCKLTIFVVTEWIGEFAESKEMLDPIWYNIDKLPKMIDTDSSWLPDLLKGYEIKGKIRVNEREGKSVSTMFEKSWLGWPI
jgi:ADP-ribose pyrophosphatase YjhB (NUDIX family)